MRIIFSAILFILILSTASAVSAVEQKSETITIGSGQKTVKYIKFNSNENVELKPALARGVVGKTDSLANIAKQNKAVAAINGTFFNAYDENDLQPLGGIIINRQPVHLAGGSVAMGISQGNELTFDVGNNINIKGGINGSREWPNNWYAWHLNHLPTSQDAIVVFTPKFRSSSLDIAGATFIVVNQGKVINISKDKATIPSEGFVIAYGSNAGGSEKFSLGDTVEYYLEYPSTIQEALHMISVGPKLVTNGHKSVDVTDFNEDKITKNPAQRSFIGFSANKDIVFGTVSNITMNDLAEVAIKMGLVEAMNLDGGASSGLYYNGSYVTAPGRALSNALVVVKRDSYPRIELNGTEIMFPDAKPFIDDGKRTLVPVRFLVNELGATIDWDANTRTVTVTRGNNEIKLTAGLNRALVNGVTRMLDTKAQIIDNRTFVPLRFITETFGAQVGFDAGRKMVLINAEVQTTDEHYQKGLDLIKAGNEEQALIEFEKAVNLGTSNSDVWKHIGNIYMNKKNYLQAVHAYQQSKQEQILLSLGWAAYSSQQFDLAIESFDKATQFEEMRGAAYYGLGVTYMHYQVKDNDLAKEAFRKVLELSTNKEQVKNAQNYLNEL